MDICVPIIYISKIYNTSKITIKAFYPFIIWKEKKSNFVNLFLYRQNLLIIKLLEEMVGNYYHIKSSS